MKIAMIGQKGLPCKYGGIERHVEALATNLVQQGHDVFVYARSSYTPTEIRVYAGVKIIHMPSIYTKHLDTITYTFVASLHALFQGYDIVHYHGVGPALLSFIPRFFQTRAVVVATVHCLDRLSQHWGLVARKFLGLGERAACFFPHITVVVSRQLQDYCQTQFKRQTIYLPNGLDWPEPLAEGWPEKLWSKFQLKPGEYILNVSRFIPSKSVHVLIQSWKQVKDQLGCKLVLVGDSPLSSQEYKQVLLDLAAGEEDILFLGWQDWEALRLLYQGAKVYVHPSAAEGLSTTILEAVGHGTPVLAADLDSNRELGLGHEYLFPPDDVEALARKLVDSSIWSKKNNVHLLRQALKQQYNWQELGKRMVKEVYMGHIF